jgi:hypothetical protein
MLPLGERRIVASSPQCIWYGRKMNSVIVAVNIFLLPEGSNLTLQTTSDFHSRPLVGIFEDSEQQMCSFPEKSPSQLLAS